ncbi:MAG: TolB-like translocation protein, partial [Planctomycetota bacterium]
PSWSPDVDRIVVVQGQTYPNIVVHELGMVSGAPAIVSSTNLTASGPLAGEKVGNPKWAKTQDLIAVSRLGSTGDYEIWIIPVANPTAAYLAFDGEWAVPTSWSPDDTQILYRGGELKALTLSNGSTTTIYSPTGHLGGSDWRR